MTTYLIRLLLGFSHDMLDGLVLHLVDDDDVLQLLDII
jgi:hypothetical protein